MVRVKRRRQDFLDEEFLGAASMADAEKAIEALEKARTAGANIQAKDALGMSAAHMARHAKVIKWLAAAGCDIDSRDNAQRTPLHRAASGGHLGPCIALARAGAEIDALDGSGRTPLAWAIAHGWRSVAMSLVAYGASRAVAPTQLIRTTALRAAVEVGLTRRLTELLDSDPSMKGARAPRTLAGLMKLAKTRQAPETVVAVLQAHGARLVIECVRASMQPGSTRSRRSTTTQ